MKKFLKISAIVIAVETWQSRQKMSGGERNGSIGWR